MARSLDHRVVCKGVVCAVCVPVWQVVCGSRHRVQCAVCAVVVCVCAWCSGGCTVARGITNVVVVWCGGGPWGGECNTTWLVSLLGWDNGGPPSAGRPRHYCQSARGRRSTTVGPHHQGGGGGNRSNHRSSPVVTPGPPGEPQLGTSTPGLRWPHAIAWVASAWAAGANPPRAGRRLSAIATGHATLGVGTAGLSHRECLSWSSWLPCH